MKEWIALALVVGSAVLAYVVATYPLPPPTLHEMMAEVRG